MVRQTGGQWASGTGEVVYSKHLKESHTASARSFDFTTVHVTRRHLFNACKDLSGIAGCMRHWAEFGRHRSLYATVAFTAGTVGSYFLHTIRLSMGTVSFAASTGRRFLFRSVADPDPGSGAFLTPESRIPNPYF
jgi:hypothetical protein